MKISVIIPTYKPKEYIWECLDSLKNQTFDKNDFEIIIGINGCCEPYKSQIQKYINNNFIGYNVIILQDNRAGASVGRNLGLDIAKGDYITFIDDDDYVSENYLEELYKIATPDVISISNTIAFNDDEKKSLAYYGLTNVYKYCKKNECNNLNSKAKKFFNGPVMKLFYKDIIGDRRFDLKFRISQDTVFNFLISDKIKNVKFTDPNCIYYRRFRSNSAVTTHRTFKFLINQTIKLILAYTNIYIKEPTKYNFSFYINRIMATSKSFLIQCLKKFFN